MAARQRSMPPTYSTAEYDWCNGIRTSSSGKILEQPPSGNRSGFDHERVPGGKAIDAGTAVSRWRRLVCRTHTRRAVIAVSARPGVNSQWVLEIQAAEPIRPQVVYRNPPSDSQRKEFEQLCYEVALVIQEALRPLCPDLRWEAETGDGALKLSGAPIPPGS